MESEPLSVHDFCRLCSEKCAVYFSLFDNQSSDMLQSLTSIKVNYDDSASKSICSRCLIELRNAYKTQQKLIQAETLLQQKLDTTREIEKCVTEIFAPQNDANFRISDIKMTDVSVNPELDLISVDYQCNKCPEKFQNTTDYVTHLDIHRTQQCKTCGKEIHIDKLREHRKQHSSGQCEICGLTLNSTNSLRNHIFRHHTETKIMCELCGAVLIDKKAHDMHLRKMHTGDATHICDYCGVKFFAMSALKLHIRDKHHNDRPFSCDVCLKAYATKSKLQIHQLKHSDKVRLICEFCGRGFKLAGNLKVHQRSVHEWVDEENYNCVICKKGFPTNLSLSNHWRIHRV